MHGKTQMNFLANPLYCILIVYVLGSLRRRSLLEGEGCLKKKKQFFFFWPCCIGIWDFSSQTRDRTLIPCIERQILNPWTTREVPRKSIHFEEQAVRDSHMRPLSLILPLESCLHHFLIRPTPNHGSSWEFPGRPHWWHHPISFHYWAIQLNSSNKHLNFLISASSSKVMLKSN